MLTFLLMWYRVLIDISTKYRDIQLVYMKGGTTCQITH